MDKLTKDPLNPCVAHSHCAVVLSSALCIPLCGVSRSLPCNRPSDAPCPCDLVFTPWTWGGAAEFGLVRLTRVMCGVTAKSC
jgi:hypothetical protein